MACVYIHSVYPYALNVVMSLFMLIWTKNKLLSINRIYLTQIHTYIYILSEILLATDRKLP